MALDSPRLSFVLDQVATGKIQLPDFQRNWKWDDERIKALIATVTLDYPLGVVMTLETGGEPQFKARTLTGADSAADEVPDLLLLDGQQRLTSLFQALRSGRPVETEDARGKKLRRWYYIDIAKAVDPNADRDDAIISVPEDRVLREDFARKVKLDLSTKELECAAGYFPLHLVFDNTRVGDWQRGFVKADDRNWDVWSQFGDRVLHNILSFQIPMIRLAHNTTKDAVCSVFERVNTGGVPLNVFELLTATYAGDRTYRREFRDDYRLPDVWGDIKKRLCTEFPVFGRFENGVEDGLSNSDFLQAVSLVHSWELKQQGRAATVACKRRDLLRLPLADFRRLEPRVADAFTWVGDFLARQCIVRSIDLPYRTQLVPLAAVRVILEERTDEPEVLERITQWYWCGVLGEMYGSATESRFSRDVEQLVAWRGTEDGVPDTITEAAFIADRINSLTSRLSAAYKGIYALIIKQGAVDWAHTEEPLTATQIAEQNIDVRYIFPKSWFARHNPDDGRQSSIVNKTVLSSQANKSMTGSPSSYLKTLARASGMRAEWFDDVVATHLIDPVTLHEEKFDRFYEDRSERLLALVEAAMGKRVVRRGGAW
ncbi:GmrSD restriction endonuclease domain-containing protein [Actinoallomurus soli]|uniref:GmrSD restriction endonuclease domain-containing protein n=1 Tax=Actinoallomurus soli TaxID=2952535 RepID=UPI002093DEDB|nr:DUF262 domain-containing protein [Actinoallomurus soli]MCO5968938.1 DUF262 domain-containing protein [Actinoallomurus soli]